MKRLGKHTWLFALALLAAPAAAQTPRIGIIDFYGLRTLTPAHFASALGVQIGDSLTLPREKLRERLLDVPGVLDARVSVVCCEAGRSIVYVGIQEAAAPQLTFHPAPTGSARLPDEVMAAGAAFMRALSEGVRLGQNEEDESAGHSVMLYPPARAAQEKLIEWAIDHKSELREVLQGSEDAKHRALAAQMIAYVPDKASILADLIRAARDPDPYVRNNAVRAIAVMSTYAQAHPEAGLSVPYSPFIDLLNSLDWTDRNKASFALAALTGSRDPAALAELREKALDAVVEMARWRAFGHAAAAGIILGRIAGLPEDQIMGALQKDREALISAARPK